MSVIDELIAGNRAFQERYPYAHLTGRPSRHVAVLTCIDTRIDPLAALGLQTGQANIVRTAGGRAADAIRSLVVATALLDVEHIAVIHHTDCGLIHHDNAAIRERLAVVAGPLAETAAAAMDFLPIASLEQSVREDIALIRASPMISGSITVRGFVYHVENGQLVEVV